MASFRLGKTLVVLNVVSICSDVMESLMVKVMDLYTFDLKLVPLTNDLSLTMT